MGYLFPHRPAYTKDGDNDGGADQAKDTVGVDVENFLRDDVPIETDASESDPIDDPCRFSSSIYETPDREEDNNRVDDQCEIWKWYAGDHRVGMDDDVAAGEFVIDITGTADNDTRDGMEEMVGSPAEIGGICERDQGDREDENVLFFHII